MKGLKIKKNVKVEKKKKKVTDPRWGSNSRPSWCKSHALLPRLMVTFIFEGTQKGAYKLIKVTVARKREKVKSSKSS